MFIGHRIFNEDYIFLILNNNYKFDSDIDNKKKKEDKIKNECINYLYFNNLNFNKKLYFVLNKIVIGYIRKDKLK